MSCTRFEERFVNLDIYGRVIGVHYKGNDAYKTKLGALVSVATKVLMTINLVNLVIAYFDGSKQEEKVQSTKFDRWLTDPVNLAE